MTLFDIEKEIENLITSGLYKVVDLDFFEKAQQIDLSSQNKEYIAETMEEYRQYLKMIDELPERYRTAFLQTLKSEEIKHNQEAENENPFLVDLYQNIEKKNSIDLASSIVKQKKQILPKDVQSLHSKIMMGTERQSEDNFSFRTKNNITVEGIRAGTRDIHFIPIDKNDIPTAVKLICDYMNADVKSDEDVFVKPFTVHALIAALQAFPDGNTRLARLICYIKLWDLSRARGITNVNLPAIYLSKSFYMMRDSYRDKIRKIVVDQDPESWNSWYAFNLHAFNEQLYFGKSNLEQLKKRI